MPAHICGAVGTGCSLLRDPGIEGAIPDSHTPSSPFSVLAPGIKSQVSCSDPSWNSDKHCYCYMSDGNPARKAQPEEEVCFMFLFLLSFSQNLLGQK